MRLFQAQWAGPTVVNTFYGPKNLALSDRIGFKKIQDGVFEQFEANIYKFFIPYMWVVPV